MTAESGVRSSCSCSPRNSLWRGWPLGGQLGGGEVEFVALAPVDVGDHHDGRPSATVVVVHRCGGELTQARVPSPPLVVDLQLGPAFAASGHADERPLVRRHGPPVGWKPDPPVLVRRWPGLVRAARSRRARAFVSDDTAGRGLRDQDADGSVSITGRRVASPARMPRRASASPASAKPAGLSPRTGWRREAPAPWKASGRLDWSFRTPMVSFPRAMGTHTGRPQGEHRDEFLPDPGVQDGVRTQHRLRGLEAVARQAAGYRHPVARVARERPRVER